MLKNGKPDSVIEGQGLDLKQTRRDPSAAKGHHSLTLGWESTPQTTLRSAVSHRGWGQSHPRAPLATSMACQLPGARKAPASCCHVTGSPQDLRAWSGQSTEVGVKAMHPALWKQTRPLHRPPPTLPPPIHPLHGHLFLEQSSSPSRFPAPGTCRSARLPHSLEAP